jgi:hypothetical protein
LSVSVHFKTGGDRLVLVDPLTNQEIPNYRKISQSLAVEKNARAQAETVAQDEALARAQAETVAQAEALARALAEERAMAAEQRLRELEATLKRRGRGKSS